MEHKLSIIMPVYNVAEYVEKSVLSILQQTYRNIELVLIDDGSTDGSSEVCQQLAESDSRIRLIRKANQGVSAARNDGLSVAKGDYITFADSDDWVDYDAYEKMMVYLQQTNSDICVMGFTPEGDDSFVNCLQKECKQVLSQNDAINKLIDGKLYTWSIWDKIYRRELLSDIAFNKDIANGEDLLFNWHAFRKAAKVAYIPLHGYHYVQRMSSMTNTFSAKKMTVMKVFDIIIADCKNESNLLRTIKEKYISTLIGLINSYWLNCDKIKFKYTLLELYEAKCYLQKEWMEIFCSNLSMRQKIAALLIIMPTVITSIGINVYYILKKAIRKSAA